MVTGGGFIPAPDVSHIGGNMDEVKKKVKPIKKEKLTKVKANHPIQNTMFKDLPVLIGCNEILDFKKAHLDYFGKHVTVLDGVKQTKDIPGSDDKKKVKAMTTKELGE